MTSTAEAPGREWERASRAASSFSRNSGGTVRWSRTWLAVRGSTAIGRTGTGSAGATDGASLTPSGRPGSSGRTWSVPTLGARPTWDAEATGAGTVVTTVREGGEATGQSSAAMTAASCLERRKKRGSTSARFSGVSTLESEAMVVRHRRPSLKGSRISGEALDERGRGHAEEGGGLGEPQLTVEEGEEAGVAQLDPAAPLVELGQGGEEVGHGVLLLAEEGGEAGGEGAALGEVHARDHRTAHFTPCPTRWEARWRAREPRWPGLGDGARRRGPAAERRALARRLEALQAEDGSRGQIASSENH